MAASGRRSRETPRDESAGRPRLSTRPGGPPCAGWAISCPIATIASPCCSQNADSSSPPATPPSASWISQITAALLRPARRARSTLASSCPARSRTPPARARSGCTLPGLTRSSRRLRGLDRNLDRVGLVVRAESAGDALPRLNRLHQARFLFAGRPLGAQPQLVAALRAQGKADPAAGGAVHEVEGLGGGELRRHHHGALALRAFAVNDHDHSALRQLLDRHLDGFRGGGAAARLVAWRHVRYTTACLVGVSLMPFD